MKKIAAAIVGLTAALTMTACGSVESADNAESTGSEGASESQAVSAEKWEAPEGLSGELDYYSANPQGLSLIHI